MRRDKYRMAQVLERESNRRTWELILAFVRANSPAESSSQHGGKRGGSGRKPSTLSGIAKRLPKESAELILPRGIRVAEPRPLGFYSRPC
jgi:hypothetical protein